VTGANPPPADAVTASIVLKDKFGGDVNKLASSYSAAETELGKLRAQITDLQKGKEPVTADDKSGDDLLKVPGKDAKAEPKTAEEMDAAAIETAKAAGLDYDALSEKVGKTGKLDDADYVAFAKQGIPRAMVDQYIENAKEADASRGSKYLTGAGLTEETFQSAADWAAKGGLTAAEGKAYDAAVGSGDPGRINQALTFLSHKHSMAVGKEPKLLNGEGGATAESYADKAQWMKDLNNPDYKTSPAFRDAVKNKLANSPALLG